MNSEFLTIAEGVCIGCDCPSALHAVPCMVCSLGLAELEAMVSFIVTSLRGSIVWFQYMLFRISLSSDLYVADSFVSFWSQLQCQDCSHSLANMSPCFKFE